MISTGILYPAAYGFKPFFLHTELNSIWYSSNQNLPKEGIPPCFS